MHRNYHTFILFHVFLIIECLSSKNKTPTFSGVQARAAQTALAMR